jgi:hypothetical protein
MPPAAEPAMPLAAEPAIAASAPSGPPPGSEPQRGRSYRGPAIVLVALIAAAAVVVVLVSGGGSSKPAGKPFAAALDPVPTNQVTGTGRGTISLNGNVATVAVDASGLLNGSPHAMHIHAGGKGVCPPASAAHLHNGHRSLSTTDGIKFYGPPQVSLTSTGDTSSKSIIDFSRFPSTGTIRYTRKITIPQGVADAISAGDAAVIVHGIDYNHNGIYDNVLDRSELSNSLPGEATAPALCGPLVASQTASTSGGGKTYAFVLDRHITVSTAGSAGADLTLLCHLLGSDAAEAPDARAGYPTAT